MRGGTGVTARNCLSPAEATLKGAVAGLVGTLAMDLVWYVRYRRDGGGDGFLEWETSAGVKSYEQAGPPAQVGKRIVEGYLQRELPPESARAMNTAVHVLTGASWGALHGIVTPSTGGPRAWHGLVTGPVAWAASYAMLAPAGVYRPMWEYSLDVLWEDLSAHLVFGLGTGITFRALTVDADERR